MLGGPLVGLVGYECWGRANDQDDVISGDGDGFRQRDELALAEQVELQAGAIPFVARDGGRADCSSGPDSQAVARITALDLGELGSGTLRATIGVPGQAADGATAELFIDGGDLPEGSMQPFWSGPVQLAELGGEGASGKLTFTSLGLSNAAEKPEQGSSGPTSAAPGWPATISGSLSWTCQPWATPLPGSVAPPPSVAP